MCAMIAENEFVIDRAKEFKNSKYIIVAKVEKAGQLDGGPNDGKVTSIMKNHFQNEITEMRKEYKQLIEVTKDEIIASNKSLESKFIEQ